MVTGAGRGIGEAIAKKLADEGAKVAVISRTEANAGKTAEAINTAHPGAAKAYAVDVADFSAVQELADVIFRDFGKVDILVNNAGVTRDGLSMRMSSDDWDVVMDTNLKGAFNFIRAVQRPMVKQRSGRIINISSVSGIMGNAGQANYAASKAGLIGLTKTIARELSGRGITVNAVAPGFIETDQRAAREHPHCRRRAHPAGALRGAGGHRRGGGISCRFRGGLRDRPDAGGGWRDGDVGHVDLSAPARGSRDARRE